MGQIEIIKLLMLPLVVILAILGLWAGSLEKRIEVLERGDDDAE